MHKYEEEHYLYDNIKDKIYPWVREEYFDNHALNGKHLSEKTTCAISFLGDLKIMFAIKRGDDSYEIIEDAMLPPDVDVVALFHTACENMARDVEFVIGNTFYGAYAIIADGVHEASSLCLKHIWNVCVDKLQDDLVIAIPTKDTLLFAEAKNSEAMERMKEHCRQAQEQTGVGILTDQWYIYKKDNRELVIYEV